MSASIKRRCRSASGDAGIATVTEYALLTGVSIVVFLSLSAALSAFSASTRDDITAVAAYNVGLTVSAAACETVGSGNASASRAIDLPEQICGMPYIAYPSLDSRSIIIRASSGTAGREVHVPVLLRSDGVLISGFIASQPAGHRVDYSAESRTVYLA